MAEMEKVSLSGVETLAIMGIPTWHLRVAARGPAEPEVRSEPETSPPAPAAEPAPVRAEPQLPPPAEPAGAAPEPAAAQLIEFIWVKGASGMLLNDLASDAATIRLLKDMVRYGDWVGGHQGAPQQGDFRWPQLVDTSGSPERALAAFVGKHLPEGGWLAMTPGVLSQLEPWLEGLGVKVLALAPLTRSLGDAAVKKEIWQQFKSLA